MDGNRRAVGENGIPTIPTRFKGELDVRGRVHAFSLSEEDADCFVLERSSEPWSISCVNRP